jgi:glycosyltransferase involved in cell wall biosynthesis
VARSSGSPPLLLTEHRGGGIGDFGLAFQRHLRSHLGELAIEETSIDGGGSFRQTAKAATYPGPLITNLGLTAWGRSGPRNFLGFAAIGMHHTLGRPTTVVVHHAIEMFDLGETGYAVSPMVQRGAHLALARVTDCDVVVFSPRLRDILVGQYGARQVRLVPHPGERTRRAPAAEAGARPKVVHAGYWALYKGIDRFIRLAARMGPSAEFVLVGRPHLGLIGDAGFRRQVERWTTEARAAGIRLPGFLERSEMDAELAGPTVGVLPYTSVSGASGSFNMFAERGVPVVATDLPEFRYLERLGAGISIAPATVEGLATTVQTLLDDRSLWLDLSERQARFSERYCWENFVAGLFPDAAGRGASDAAKTEPSRSG